MSNPFFDHPILNSPYAYPAFLVEVKERILRARISAARAINHELVLLYWDIGRGIVEKQQALGWGESVIDRLSSDLQAAFPQATGFSPRNLRDTKRFYLAYSDASIWRQPVAELLHRRSSKQNPIWPQAVAKLEGPDGVIEFLRQLVAEIPWGHHRLILDKMSDPAARIACDTDGHACVLFGNDWSVRYFGEINAQLALEPLPPERVAPAV